MLEMLEALWVGRVGALRQGVSHLLTRSRAARGTEAAPAKALGTLLGVGDGTRLDREMSLQVEFMFHINRGRGLPWAFLRSICSREQEGNKKEGAQLESRSQAKAISKCMQML